MLKLCKERHNVVLTEGYHSLIITSRIPIKRKCLLERECSRHDFTCIRGWMQMVTGTKWFIFLKQEYSKAWFLMGIHYIHYVTHYDTHSLHNHHLKSWWSRLLCPQSSCYVFPPTLSGIIWCSLPLPGGLRPHTPKVASLFPGSAHTPSPWFRTGSLERKLQQPVKTTFLPFLLWFSTYATFICLVPPTWPMSLLQEKYHRGEIHRLLRVLLWWWVMLLPRPSPPPNPGEPIRSSFTGDNDQFQPTLRFSTSNIGLSYISPLYSTRLVNFSPHGIISLWYWCFALANSSLKNSLH